MRQTTEMRTSAARPARPLMSWGAIFGGAAVGLALLALLTSLWMALGYGSGTATVRDKLEWFIGISALSCLLIGGIITGYLTGIRSETSGLLHGWALWSLLLIVTIAIGIPSVLNISGLGRVANEVQAGGTLSHGSALWASFWTILGGFGAAGIGGAIGGATARRTDSATLVHTVAESDHDDHRVDERSFSDGASEGDRSSADPRPDNEHAFHAS